MSWPSVVDYSAAVQNSAKNFADPALKRARAAPGLMGLPLSYSGNFACVFKLVEPDGRAWAAKCFTRKVSDTQMRYARISEHLGRHPRSFAVHFDYKPQGICVEGQWYPIVMMDWVEGLRLNELLAEQADNAALVGELSTLWLRLAGVLREAGVAHGDLHHGNILARSAGGGAALRLIDYDGMWVPALDGNPPDEAGQPNYQHPARQEKGAFNRDMDRFSQLVIYTALRCLVVGGKALWDRHDEKENLLFQAADFARPMKSRLWPELLKLPDPQAAALAGHLLLASQGAIDQVPPLHEVVRREGVVPLAEPQRKRVNQVLAGELPSTASTGVAWWSAGAGTPHWGTPVRVPAVEPPQRTAFIPDSAPPVSPPPATDNVPKAAPTRRKGQLLGAGVGVILLLGIGIGVLAFSSWLTKPGENAANYDTKDATPDDPKAKEGPAFPKGKDFGRLVLALDEPRLRYGDPIRLRLTAGAGNDPVPLEAIVGELEFTLDGGPLEEQVVVDMDGRVELKGKRPVGSYRLAARFGGNDVYTPAESDPVTFHVERNRLGAFTVQPVKKSVKAGEKGLEVELKWMSPPTLVPKDVERFRFSRVPEAAGQQETPLRVTPVAGQPWRVRLVERLKPGNARISAKYPRDDRFEEAVGVPTAVIQIPNSDVLFRFPSAANAWGETAPDERRLYFSRSTPLRVRVVPVGEEDDPRPPRGAINATVDSTEVRTPAELKDGVAEVVFDARDLPINTDVQRKVRLEYRPAQGAGHNPVKHEFSLPIIEERILQGFSIERKQTPLAGYRFADRARKGKVTLILPKQKQHFLRLRPPDAKVTAPHSFYGTRSPGNRLPIWWSSGVPVEAGFADNTMARFTLEPPKGLFEVDASTWSLSWELFDFWPNKFTGSAEKQKELTRRFTEACEKPDLLQACVVEVVWKRPGAIMPTDYPVVLRFLLSRPPEKIKDPPKKQPPR